MIPTVLLQISNIKSTEDWSKDICDLNAYYLRLLLEIKNLCNTTPGKFKR